jgi:hypothetical protein
VNFMGGTKGELAGGGHATVEISAGLTALEAQHLAQVLQAALPRASLMFSVYGRGIPSDVRESLQAKLGTATLRVG